VIKTSTVRPNVTTRNCVTPGDTPGALLWVALQLIQRILVVAVAAEHRPKDSSQMEADCLEISMAELS
jgi:hypothetical protein